MLEHHGDTWGDKVRILGVSIDSSSQDVVKHVNTKGWKKVEHFHRDASTCSNDYGVSGVPKVVLIDTEGKIAFAGHPAERNLEADIETLMKGDKLKGLKSAGGGAEEDETFKELDIAKVDEELTNFEEKVKSVLMKN